MFTVFFCRCAWQSCGAGKQPQSFAKKKVNVNCAPIDRIWNSLYGGPRIVPNLTGQQYWESFSIHGWYICIASNVLRFSSHVMEFTTVGSSLPLVILLFQLTVSEFAAFPFTVNRRRLLNASNALGLRESERVKPERITVQTGNFTWRLSQVYVIS